jgi:hypothetical protein
MLNQIDTLVLLPEKSVQLCAWARALAWYSGEKK